MSPGLAIMLVALVSLAIPIVILVGLILRRPQSSLIAISAATLVALAVFWFLLGGVSGAKGGAQYNNFVLSGSLLLLIASWALGLAASVESHRWVWVALLILAGYLSVSAALVSIVSPDPCLFPPTGYDDFYTSYCQNANSLGDFLVAAGYFLAPAVALASALPLFSQRGLPLRRHGPPDGLNVSPLAATANGDTDPELRAERL